ncbi:MAG: MarR family transcriptional regulator [Alphaproteobacteria bacterium]|nr:MarR family transcriptional regulator [Alphaproteobacteria bacterium]
MDDIPRPLPRPKEESDAAADESRTRGLEALEHSIPYKLYKLALRGSAAKSAHIKKTVGLAIDEWKVLLLIGTFAPLSTKEVAERSTLDKVRISRTTDRLVKAGLITAARDGSDGRKIELRLTRRGRTKYQGVVASLTAWDGAFVEALSARERQQLDDMLQALDARIDALATRF